MKQAYMPDSLYAELGKLNTRAQLLLFHLLTHSDGEYKSCWPSQWTLQKETGFSKNTLIRATRDLEKMRCLVMQRTTTLDKNGRYNTSVKYHFNFDYWISLDRQNDKHATLSDVVNHARKAAKGEARKEARKVVTRETAGIRAEVMKMLSEAGFVYRYHDGQRYHVEQGYLSKEKAATIAAEFAEKGVQLKLLKTRAA